MATDFSKVDRLMNQMIKDGLGNLGKAVKDRGIILAPKDSGDLRRSSKVEVNKSKDSVAISFNMPYAKRRHYENNLHPSTRLYLTNAMKSIGTPAKFFKKVF